MDAKNILFICKMWIINSFYEVTGMKFTLVLSDFHKSFEAETVKIFRNAIALK